jgi:predicted DNA-binding transcriptional regulator YafY
VSGIPTQGDKKGGCAVRAGRLVTLLLLLERRGRLTAAELAAELEVSERTVLRDVEALSGAGVPVFAVRGPGGGYELLEGTGTALSDPGTWQPMDRRAGRVRRATVRVTPDGRRLAAVLGRLQPLRLRRSAAPDAAGRLEATFRMGPFESAVLDLCSLGPDIEVLAPEDLRLAVATRLVAAVSQYAAEERGSTESEAALRELNAPISASSPPVRR